MSISLMTPTEIVFEHVDIGMLVHVQVANGFREILKCRVLEKTGSGKIKIEIISVFDCDGKSVVIAHTSVPSVGSILDVDVAMLRTPRVILP